jgi:hypothetical protein
MTKITRSLSLPAAAAFACALSAAPGYAGFAATGSTASMVIRDSTASSNMDGVLAQSGATIRIDHSVVALNTSAGLVASAGSINSYGDNDINGNTTDESGTINVIVTR